MGLSTISASCMVKGWSRSDEIRGSVRSHGVVRDGRASSSDHLRDRSSVSSVRGGCGGSRLRVDHRQGSRQRMGRQLDAVGRDSIMGMPISKGRRPLRLKSCLTRPFPLSSVQKALPRRSVRYAAIPLEACSRSMRSCTRIVSVPAGVFRVRSGTRDGLTTCNRSTSLQRGGMRFFPSVRKRSTRVNRFCIPCRTTWRPALKFYVLKAARRISSSDPAVISTTPRNGSQPGSKRSMRF